MKEILPSDWTLAAFQQREEERRTKEQTEAAVTPPQQQINRNTEPLRSEWTIAALQQRFAGLERRIATLEQMAEEQRGKETVEATTVAPRAEASRVEAMLLANPTPAAPDLVDQPPQFAAARIANVRVEASGPAREQRLKQTGSRTKMFDAQGLEREQIDLRPHETAHVEPGQKVEPGHKKARGFTSFIVTTVAAGTIGFAAAIYEVPIEKAVHFRALTKRGLDSIYERLSTSVKQ